MLSWNVLVTACLAYGAFLFAVAFWAERRAEAGKLGWLQSPFVYTLSLSVYCTGWTFYGAVGSAARNGLEFVTIYLGPSLVFFGWWWLLRKLVRIGHMQRITSIADMISSRYGKSPTLGVVVTLLAVIGTTPYIALQLQSLSLSFSAFSPVITGATPTPEVTAFWMAIGLALFTILFGTRNVDANERHTGVVTAIALEAIVKLAALLSVGIFVVWGISAGPGEALSNLPPLPEDIFTPRWVTLTFLAATAIICLPRMFQVTVVENSDERHLATASWAFPLYLFLISLFVLPIAIAGQNLLPEGSNPDLFVLTVPLSQGADLLSLFAFLGGFSAATSMVIVAAIALSTMISNHIVVPSWLWLNTRRTVTSGDVRQVILGSRRISMGLILGLGYFYFRLTGGSAALASIGLIAFAGVAQILPSLIGGLYWRGATRTGALAAIAVGSFLWAYTLFLPSFEGSFLITPATLANGPFGIEMLRPQALFGSDDPDPLVHSVFWSMTLNVIAFVSVSLMTKPQLMERIQSAQFVDAFRLRGGRTVIQRSATSEDLFTLAQRILGTETAHRLFASEARAQGKPTGLPDPSEELISRVERELTGSVGAASAHAMVSQITGTGLISVEELLRMADETAQIVEYSHELEVRSTELAETAEQLRTANAQLTALSEQKDAFLSQVSHELRTPMTSIRSFAEILRDDRKTGVDPAQSARFVTIIHEESQRLTRLLDEILDLTFLESGRAKLNIAPHRLGDIVDAAVSGTEGLRTAEGVQLSVAGPSLDIRLRTDFDRLAQVLINLISNAVKYGRAKDPKIGIAARLTDTHVLLDISDNGPGIAQENRARVFEKFARLDEATLAGSAGLGLPISLEIMHKLGGDLTLEDSNPGAVFRVHLPL